MAQNRRRENPNRNQSRPAQGNTARRRSRSNASGRRVYDQAQDARRASSQRRGSPQGRAHAGLSVGTVLLVASYVFYAWWRVDFLALFIGVTVWNYWIGLKVGAAGVRTKPAQRWLLLGVVVDLGILGYFKYANFGVDSINAMIERNKAAR